MRLCSPLLLIALALPVLPAPEGRAAGAVKTEALTVQSTDLAVVVEVDASLEAVTVRKLKLVPDEAGGPFTVAEMLPSGRVVEAGAVVARFEGERFVRWLRSAREGLGTATAKLERLRKEQAIIDTGHRLKLERLQQDLVQAERDVQTFTRFGEEQWLKGRAVALQQQVQQQTNREEELAQLEKMYKESQIAGDTRDIVLNRSRREAAIGRDNLELARKAEQLLLTVEHPQHVEKLQQELEHHRQDLDQLRSTIANGDALRSEELASAERAVRDAQEYHDRLLADQARMTVSAPIAGILRHGGIEGGDKVNAHTVFAEIHDPARCELRLQLTLRDVQVVHVGDRILVRIPDLPLLELGAAITDIALTATHDAQGTARYQVKALVDAHPLLRLGARARAEIHGPVIKEALAIPRKAVLAEDGRWWCRIRNGESTDRREILLGSGTRDQVQVVRGLAAGDVVLVKDAKE